MLKTDGTVTAKAGSMLTKIREHGVAETIAATYVTPHKFKPGSFFIKIELNSLERG